MISPNQIGRMVETEAWVRLVGRILANGRCRSPEAIKRLQGPDVAPVAAPGLALQRMCELTYRPSSLASRLANRLLALQRQDGLFEPPRSQFDRRSRKPSVSASAIAVRGLLSWREQCAEAGLSRDPRVDRAIESAFDALAEVVGDTVADGIDRDVARSMGGWFDAELDDRAGSRAASRAAGRAAGRAGKWAGERAGNRLGGQMRANASRFGRLEHVESSRRIREAAEDETGKKSDAGDADASSMQLDGDDRSRRPSRTLRVN